MKTALRPIFVFSAFALCFLTIGQAHAQTEPVTATVIVQNTLTVTEVDPLDFGIVAVVSDATDVATLAVDANAGTLAATTTGAPAVFAVVDNTTVSASLITIEDAADGAALNFTIDNVVNPVLGPSAFTLEGWETSWNGGAITARTAATPFSYTFSAVFNAGVNEIRIGAEIDTQTAVATYADGTYVGGFELTASY